MSWQDQCSAPGCVREVGKNGAKGMCLMHYRRKGSYEEVTHLTSIDAFDKGWLIGLYEGEGYVSFMGKHTVQMGITMSDEDTVRRVHEVIKLGVVYGPYPAPSSDKLLWTIKVCKSIEALALLQWMLPHLSIRRGLKAEKAILRLRGGQNFKIMSEAEERMI